MIDIKRPGDMIWYKKIKNVHKSIMNKQCNAASTLHCVYYCTFVKLQMFITVKSLKFFRGAPSKQQEACQTTKKSQTQTFGNIARRRRKRWCQKQFILYCFNYKA